jgi:hypothetical protein
MGEQMTTPLLGAVAAGSSQTMVGQAFQNYQMNDGTTYSTGSDGVINAQPRHVQALLVAGLQFKASGLPA